jgi:glycerophosphoryl diester phosphodiesterase|tara:strand:- start:603 stop:1379 length:777 start_codon:yes stop_codon:yes gene_type:complete
MDSDPAGPYPESIMSSTFDLQSIPFVCIGHRGACGYEPENTLSSFECAIAMGCDWIELDVYQVEGELLVIHDDTLNRTTNGRGEVVQQTLAYLRSLDAGKGQQIPKLTEVVRAVDHRAGINIELKGEHTASPVVDLLHQFEASGWDPAEFLISSFDHVQLAQVGQLEPRLRTGALFSRDAENCIAKAIDLRAFSLNLGLRLVDADLVQRIHAAGLKVYVFTVNHTADISRMMADQVDGVFTNFPDRVLEMQKEIQNGR